MNARTRLAYAALTLGLGVAGVAAAQTPLPKESPFSQTGASQQAAAAPTESVEFSGIAVGNKTLVIIYDKVAKKSRIIPVGDTVDGIEVLNYDPGREQVSVKIGGEQKLLRLRKSTGSANGPAPGMGAPNPAMNFNIPPPPASVVQKIQPPPPAVDPASAAPVPTAPPVAPVTKPDEPAKPLTIARQEEEARMLVSDLLEIGMAQRKAYEEKQRQAAAAEQTAAATPPAPAPVQPTPQPN